MRPTIRRAPVVALALAALPAILVTPAAHAGAWIPDRGESVSQVSASLFSATSAYDATGERAPSPVRWQDRTLMGAREVGWIHHTSLRYRVPFQSATVRNDFGSYTSTGISDLALGLRLGMRRGQVPMTVSIDWMAPAGYNRAQSLLGEGLQQLTSAIDIGWAFSPRGFVQGSIAGGERYLSLSQKPLTESARRRATIGLASADAGWWLRPALLLGGRYQGYVTTSTGIGEPTRNLHVAGPFALLRVNETLDLQAGTWSGFSGKYEPAGNGATPLPRALHYDQVYVAAMFRQIRTTRLLGQLGVTRQP